MRKNHFLILCIQLIALISFSLSACHSGNENLNRNEALSVLDSKIKKNPDNAELYYQRGKLLVEMGKDSSRSDYFKEAVADLGRATHLDESKADYYTALADAHFSLGNVASSYNALQKALAIDQNNFEANLKMSEIAFYSKDFDRAMESLNHVTEQDKNNQTALFMKGFIYKETGDTANAVHYFRRLIDLYPDYEPAYEELGFLYSQHGNKLGVEYLTTALSLQPDNINVLYGLAMLYQDVEEADKATEYYVKILEIDPNNKNAWFNRGWMEMVLYEDYDAAVDFFKKAIECDNNYGEAYYNAGYAYQLKGDTKNANSYFDQARQLGYESN